MSKQGNVFLTFSFLLSWWALWEEAGRNRAEDKLRAVGGAQTPTLPEWVPAAAKPCDQHS